MYKVFINIKLKTFKSGKLVEFMLCVLQLSVDLLLQRD